ncbi:hypothetical protein GHT06_022040 [Daphnia sinensis]|uniref:Peptidase S1 domain-containing protein n=1 Tax=Daphnia sinensis TaxID=1820382 RepID=A0AAD5KGQ5_9CRUS|nr:hypothetical protein GHT06_022040 [Daphnia sinensis]
MMMTRLLASTNGLPFLITLIIFTTIKSADGQCESCTLTVMCWMNGGIREGGCPGPSWLVTCCVPQVTRNSEDDMAIQSDNRAPLTAGLRSAPGGAPFILANTLGESIANLQGRDDFRGGVGSSSQPYISHARFYMPPNHPSLFLRFEPRLREPPVLPPVLPTFDNVITTTPGMSTSPSQQLHYFMKNNNNNNKAPGSPFSSSAVPYNQLQPPLPPPLPPSPPQLQPQHHVMTQQQLYQHKNFQMQQQMFPQQPHGFIGLNSLNSLSGPRPVCGVQPLKSSKLQKRIIGGDQAAFGEFPWQAHIRIAGFQCGGVLLNHQYIATAAHCVHRAKLSQIIIYLGEYDTKDLDKAEILPKETLGVIERKIHPQFKYMLTQPDRYDVAVLKLSRSVGFRDNILPICLPPQGKDYEGALGVVAGWGKTDTSFGKTGTNLLQKVYVPIINNRVCYAWHELKDIILELHDEMFCAGHEQGKMDACLGDSGGPLVVNDGGRWTLVGITSAGFGCAVDHQPGIYHKVSKTVPWILANIND